MKEPLILINHYTKKFKKFIAANNVTFNINKGTIHGIIGPNGAGKTTIIKGIIGAYRSSKNQILINGFNAGSEKANALIGYIPERASFPKHLNCIKYLITMGRLSGLKKPVATKKAKDIIEKLNLTKHSKRKPIYFSTGMKKKILMSQALINDPSILILDEPASGLDPTSRNELFNLLLKLKNDGTTIFISSHILSELNDIVDEITIINSGKIIFSGIPSKEKGNKSDLFIKSNNNLELIKFIKKEFPKYDAENLMNKEIIIKNLTKKEKDNLFIKIISKTDISIDSSRSNNLQSIYDKMILEDKINNDIKNNNISKRIKK